MAYLGSQAAGDEHVHQEVLTFIGSLDAANPSKPQLTIDTVNVKKIDFIEISFRPDPAETNLDILGIRWKNTNNKNNSGLNVLWFFPRRSADGSYHYEPNHPPNLYTSEGGYTHLSRKLEFEFIKLINNAKVVTLTLCMRVNVTKFMSTRMLLDNKFQGVILNE